MNKLSLSILLCTVLAACNTEKKTVEAGEAITNSPIISSQATTYNIDLATSTLEWTGSEGFVFNIENAHNGTLLLTQGTIVTTDTSLLGSFEVDINSLKVLDIKKESSNKKLTSHLLSADFFEAEKFPAAQFEILSTQPTVADSVSVTGNLTLKGITKSIVFPARVVNSDSTINAAARFYINRKDWGMHYRSEDSFGDEMIRPEVLIKFNILASK